MVTFKNIRLYTFALFVLLAAACKHPQEIVGDGDIVSSNGLHDCALVDAPCENLVEGEYAVTYTAVPHPGWRFSRWEGCGQQYPQCTFNIPSNIVELATGKTVNPLRAIFEPLAAAEPNILVIMADDLGYNDLAINNGNAEIHTPNMDQIANEGVLFQRHYANHVCSPARAAFLTGISPARLGYIPNGPGISSDIETMPERLSQMGYTTWHIGKWHVGDHYRVAWPDYQGFDHWFGFLNQWRLAGQMVGGEIQLVRPRYEDPWLEGSGVPGKHYSGHLENILTDKTLDVLQDLQAEQAPWFLNLWFYAPHGPITPAAEFAQLYPDTTDGRYKALVHQLDHNIGRIIDHLELTGVIDNTIVVVVSDNGGSKSTVETYDNNAPYAGGKASLREGGLRTPLIIRWPDGLSSGSVVNDTVAIQDIYPTLLEALGEAEPAGLDGDSFYLSMQGLQLPVARELFWEKNAVDNSHGALTADGRWRLEKPSPFWGVEIGPYLYDLELDPTGTFAEDPPPPLVLADIQSAYSDWFMQVHQVETGFVPNGQGGGTLHGRDLLRTPGLGRYTFGIAVGAGHEGNIASQAGLWQLSQSGDQVAADFGDLSLSGTLASPGQCNSIVFSGNFKQVISSGTVAGIDLSLYINGVLVDSDSDASGLEVPDTTLETVIGDPAFPANAPLTAPVILNRSLDSESIWSVESFSAALCP